MIADKEAGDGVIELIQKVFGSQAISSNPYVNATTGEANPYSSGIVFSGRTRVESKRALLRYWSQNHQSLGVDFRELQNRCRILDDEKTIVLEQEL